MPDLPAKSDTSSLATPASWPMTFVWLGDHWLKDWMRFWSGAARIGDPMDSIRTEGAAASDVARDWMVALGALWTLPVSTWLAAKSPLPDKPR